jgi:putative sterol carrier protein
MQVFSPDWAVAYQQAINTSTTYASTSARWEEGKLALVLNRDDGSRGVLLDLLHGKCLEARSIPLDTALAEATFVITGDEATWREVLGGTLQPLMGIMRGKLKLTQGSIGKLMPYTLAANELVRCAQTLETEF